MKRLYLAVLVCIVPTLSFAQAPNNPPGGGIVITGTTPTVGHCAQFSGPTSLTDAGASCASGGGATLPSATTSQLFGGTGSANSAAAVTLGTNLTLSGGVLNATSGTNNPGGTAGQIQVSTGTAFGGVTPGGDVSAFNATTGAFTIGSIGGKTVSLGGAFSTSGPYSLSMALTGATAITLPTSGTLTTNALGNLTLAAMPNLLTSALWSNISNPILSQPGTNTPAVTTAYLSTPLAVGYAETLTANLGTAGNIYDNMVTAQISLPSSGTVTSHYGLEERELQIMPGSGTISAEVNNYKNYVEVDAGATVSNGGLGENIEEELTVSGTVNYWTSNTAFINILAGGAVNTYVGYNIQVQNNSTNTLGTYYGYLCSAPTGTGSVGNNVCFYNSDKNAEISNIGHWGTKPSGSGLSVSCTGTGGGTTDARPNDHIGIVTEGTGSTGCTVTTAVTFGSQPHCIVTPQSATSPIPAVTAAGNGVQTTCTWTHASSNASVYAYQIEGTY